MEKSPTKNSKSKSKSPPPKSILKHPLTKSLESPRKSMSSRNEVKAKLTEPSKSTTYNFPSNANEFRHIIEDLKCCSADVDFMLKLRRYNILQRINKTLTMNEPSFYNEDFNSFKKKIDYDKKKFQEDKKLLKINIGIYNRLFSDRAKYAINNPTFKYEIKLRTEGNEKISKSLDKAKNTEANNEQNSNNTVEAEKRKNRNFRYDLKWNNSILPKERSLFDTLLPPILARSKENFKKIENKVSYPINRIDKFSEINGEKIKGRIFNFNSINANRYPSEHFPSSPYTNDYATKNVGALKHIMNSDGRAMTTYWSSYLRGFKTRVMTSEEIKNREKKLKDKSHEKSMNK